ncbi:MAG: hypothetical protein P4M08_12295 [Oligoflexia bacterium]|nr:hypothetical protein [Oligoflexia bacterium]
MAFRRYLKTAIIAFAACGVLALWLLVLRPYLINGFWDDDALSSVVRGEVGRSQTTLAAFIQLVNSDWIRNAGRFFPVALVIDYSGFYFIRPLEYFRFYQVSLVLLNVALFGCLLRRMGAGRAFSGLVCLSLLGSFQVHRHYDPVGSYAPLMQTTGILFSLACLPLTDLGTGRVWLKLLVSAFFAFACLLNYEVGLVFLPVYLYLILSQRRDWKLALPLGSVSMAYLAIVLYCRHRALSMYPGIRVGTFLGFIDTFFKQLTASLPLISYLGVLHRDPKMIRAISETFLRPESWLIFLACAALFFALLRRVGTQKAPRPVLVTAAILAVGPSFLVGASGKCQAELDWSVGYLPVYLSYFGTAILLAHWLAHWICRRRRTGRTLLLISMGLAWVVALTQTINLRVAASLDEGQQFPRFALETALENGLFSGLRDGDRVTTNFEYAWASSAFIYEHSGKRVFIVGHPDYSYDAKSPSADTPLYALRLDVQPDGGWRAELSDARSNRVAIMEQAGSPPSGMSERSFHLFWLRALYHPQLPKRLFMAQGTHK